MQLVLLLSLNVICSWLYYEYTVVFFQEKSTLDEDVVAQVPVQKKLGGGGGGDDDELVDWHNYELIAANKLRTGKQHNKRVFQQQTLTLAI